ncbi:hypothetical protein J2S13_000590 [Oikeobacillus pervagus]|uniref:DUF4179 domain-containing protein n=1 Tax=Oikeobacillus pervagus TaxID=1325931 RepID=A0AAJ1T1G1_9BACI|nr:DUF4179 domain-containing protein [Oikeobacillus pervagus]MDQ0214194.1 hypothetical protein [Oikeobacillus pervagus]
MEKKDFNLEEKDIYKLLNGIKMDESEWEGVEMEISPLQKKRIKNNLKRRINASKKRKRVKYASGAAAIGLAAMIGIGAISPTFAENIPVIGSVLQALNGDKGDYAKYSQILDQGVTDNGLTLMINEVVADESKLMIGYTIKSDQKFDDEMVGGLTHGDIKINGKSFWASGGGTGKLKNSYTYVGSDEFDISSLDVADKFNVSLNVRELAGVKGKWKFAFDVSKNEISQKTVVFKPNQKVKFPKSAINIDKVVFSPIGSYIYLSGKYRGDKAGAHGIFEYSDWFAFDDKGNELTQVAIGAGSADRKSFHSQMEYSRVKEIPKSLTIIPVDIAPSGGGGVDEDGNEYSYKGKEPNEVRKPLDRHFPMELQQGKLGKITIKEMITENNQTKVIYTVEGRLPTYQANSLTFEDEHGNVVENEVMPGNSKNEFIQVLPALDAHKRYQAVTHDFSHMKINEDLIFTIKLK